MSYVAVIKCVKRNGTIGFVTWNKVSNPRKAIANFPTHFSNWFYVVWYKIHPTGRKQELGVTKNTRNGIVGLFV